jgi:glycerol-3-phosphate dehydrogenase
MNVLLACTAAKLGADLANHVEVTKLYKKYAVSSSSSSSFFYIGFLILSKAGEVKGVYVRDVLTGEAWQIRAKGVINATGPFSDSIRRMDDPNVEKMVLWRGLFLFSLLLLFVCGSF